MKLTEIQLQNIESYLINDAGLEYKEFIDEMNDHFIDSIEAKMDAGTSFFFALEATGEEFRDEICQPYPLGLFAKKGLKALEKRFYESKKREVDAEINLLMKSSLFSYSSFLIVCYAVSCYYLFENFSETPSNITSILLLPLMVSAIFMQKRLKGNVAKAGGLAWLFAGKRHRVRSIYIDSFLNNSAMQSVSWLSIPWLVIYFATRLDVLTVDVYLYFTLFVTCVFAFVQVQAFKMIPRVNKLIEA